MYKSKIKRQKHKISVILPNYNHGKFISNSIDQLLLQKKDIFEIIIIDDASTDNSVEIIKKKIDKSKLFKFFQNKKNLGTIATQNKGIKLSRGKYIYLAAADDYILPNFFHTSMSYFKNNNSCKLVCGDSYILKDNFQTDIRPTFSPALKARFFNSHETLMLFKNIDNFIITGASIIETNVIKEENFLDDEFKSYADGILLRKIANRHGFFYLNFPVAVWRVYKNSFSKQDAILYGYNNILINLFEDKLLKNKHFDDNYRRLFLNRVKFSNLRVALEYNEEKHLHVEYILKSKVSIILYTFISKVFNSYINKSTLLLLCFFETKPVSFKWIFITLLVLIIKKIRYSIFYRIV